MSINHLPVIVSVCVLLSTACTKRLINPIIDDSPVGTIWKLNKNVEGLTKLASACMEADSVAILHFDYNEDGSVLYWLSMKQGGDIELLSEIVSEKVRVPELSMTMIDGKFYWTVNGVFLADPEGNRVVVTDVTKPVSFLFQGHSICCKVKDSIVDSFPITKADYLAKDIAFNYDFDRKAFNFRLSSGYSAALPTVSHFELLNAPVRNLSYYKDVFLDAGVGLDYRKSLPAVTHLNLSLEGIALPYSRYSAEDKALQKAVIVGDSGDLNGRLLYPDGQPRFKMLYVIGGDSIVHGQSLGGDGLNCVRSFVENGGSYVGSCAGAFLASNGYDGHTDYAYYLSIWPGMMRHSGLKKTYTGMAIEKDGPLSQYFSFGGDHYVDSVYHNYGGFADDSPEGTEVLARFDIPTRKSVHNTPSVWAYKASDQTGRIVLTGSHPEIVTKGERRDLTASMMLYAMAGVGTATLKGYLRNGEERVMDKKTTDNIPDYTCIGDRQTHHFATYIPSGAKNIHVEVNGVSNCDFALMMNQGSYAFSSTAEYCSSDSGATQQLNFSSLKEGFWFIGVKCLTTVTVVETEYGQAYSGHTEVLNGIPYKVSICWD